MSKNTTSNQEPEISELVNTHINNLDEKGKLQLPDNMPEWQKHVIRAEKRQRDAQSALSATQKTLREAEAAKAVLEQQALAVVPEEFKLSADEARELENIKYRDPDAYRLRVNQLEQEAKEAQAKKLGELTTSASQQAHESFIAKDRITVLEEFRAANPAIQLTDEVLVNDVPPRFMNDLNNGKYDYHTYLTKVTEYLQTAKVLPGQTAGDEHNLGHLAGSTTPGKAAAERAGRQDYAKVTF